MTLALEARVAQLEGELAALRATLAGAAPGHTMRALRRCVACGGTSIVHQKHVKLTDGMGSLSELTLVVRHSPWTGDAPLCPFEAYACTSCGLVEWYVRTFEHFDAARDARDGVEFIAGNPPRGEPYR
jgi:hypothetical protein